MRVGGWVVSLPAACVNLYGWVRRLCSSLVSHFGNKAHHPESPGGRSSQIEFRGLPVGRISHTGTFILGLAPLLARPANQDARQFFLVS